jgi:GntR family transcriptional repressor for pyruvate dehydrogenase complex
VSSLRADALLGPLQFFLSLDEASIGALYDARELIEGGIASRAASVATAADITHLREIIDAQTSALGDPRAYRMWDIAFHERVHAMGANPFLARAATSLNTLGLEFRTLASESRDVIAQSVIDHTAIVVALAAGDATRADEAMRRHMRNVLKSTRDAMERTALPTEPSGAEAESRRATQNNDRNNGGTP